MNKKVLVITLALIVAFAGSAMAEVKFSGKFTATAEQKNFKVFQEGYHLTSGFEFNISSSNKNTTEFVEVVEKEEAVLNEDGEETGETAVVLETVTEERVNWDFTGGIKLVDSEFKLGKYKLYLNDNYFEAWAWGNGQNLSDKATYFDMIKAGKGSPADKMRARVAVPVMDLGKVTVDFEQNDNVRVFAEGTVEGYNVGLAYARKDWTSEDDIQNVIVGQAGGAIAAGDYTVNAKAAAGVALGTDLGFALGLSADTKVTEELKIEGSVTHANENWAADALSANYTVLSGKGTYTEKAYQAIASVKHTLIKEDESKNEISLSGSYRLSEKVAYNKLFNTDPSDGATFFNLDAPAFGVSAKFVDFKFDNVEAKAAAPVVEDMVWVLGTAKYLGDSKFEAGVLGHILATNKLTVKPSVDYTSADKEFDVKLVADYKIGYSDTVLGFTAKKVLNETKDGEGLLQAKITVPF